MRSNSRAARATHLGQSLALSLAALIAPVALAQKPATPPAAAPAATKPAEVDPIFNYEVNDKEDIAELDYWEFKFAAVMMEEAVKTKQPQGPMSIDLAVMLRELPDYIKKHPDNENLQKWQKRAKEINDKLDPNADRGKSFKPGFLWDDNAFKQSWCSMHLAKMALADKDYEVAYMHYNNALRNLNQLLTIDKRMEDWSEEAIKWVNAMKPIAQEKNEELAKKTHHA